VYKKAARIRKAISEQKEISVSDLEWLRAYEANKQTAGRPVIHAADPSVDSGDAAGDDDGADEGDEGEDLEAVPEGEGDPAPNPSVDPIEPPVAPPQAPLPPPPPPGPRPRVGRPPRVDFGDSDRRDSAGPKREKWQARYEKEGSAREQTVKQAADLVIGVLEGMTSELAAVGVKAAFQPEDLRAPWILTLDEWLPKHVEVKPMHVAVVGATTITIQRFMHRQKIAAMKGAKSDADAMRARAEARRKATEAKQDNPEPTEPASTAPMAITVVDHPAPTEPAWDPVATNGLGRKPLTRDEWRAQTESLLSNDPKAVI
jgi:hypothetical protein